MKVTELPHWARHAVDSASECIREAWTGATNTKAMPAHHRHLCGFKLAVGILATAFCLAVDENLLITTATAIPAVESVHDYIQAGAEFIKAHHHHAPHV